MQYCNALHFCLYNYYKVQHGKVTALNLNIGWALVLNGYNRVTRI